MKDQRRQTQIIFTPDLKHRQYFTDSWKLYSYTFQPGFQDWSKKGMAQTNPTDIIKIIMKW